MKIDAISVMLVAALLGLTGCKCLHGDGIETQNKKAFYPDVEQVTYGSKFVPIGAAWKVDPEPGGPLLLVRAADGIASARNAYAAYTGTSDDATDDRAPAKQSAAASSGQAVIRSVAHSQPTFKSIFWWRYLRGIWPLQQTASVVAASEGTNAVLAIETDANDPLYAAHYVIVLPEDVLNKTARVQVTVVGDSSQIAPITVPGFRDKADLLNNAKRIEAARYRRVYSVEGRLTLDPPANADPAKVTDNPVLVNLLNTRVFPEAEVKAAMRDAIDKPPQ